MSCSGSCRVVCQAALSNDARLGLRCLVDALQCCAARFGVGAVVSRADAIFAIEVLGRTGVGAHATRVKRVIFVHLVAASGRFGSKTPTQTFALLNVSDGAEVFEAPYRNLALTWSCAGFVKPARALLPPYGRQAQGMFVLQAAQELAHCIATSVDKRHVLFDRVVINELSYIDSVLREVEVAGEVRCLESCTGGRCLCAGSNHSPHRLASLLESFEWDLRICCMRCLSAMVRLPWDGC